MITPRVRSAGLLIALSGAILALGACAYAPHKRAVTICPDCRALQLNQSGRHPLRAYLSKPRAGGTRWHIYLEGDGRPFVNHRYPRNNPSSRKLSALRLMALDPQNSIYLNRPCYGYRTLPSSCEPSLWTDARYSREVVEALDRAVTELTQRYAIDNLVLIGHSGGGTLAVLLAQRRRDVRAVVTLAANLDHRAWTEALGYRPLEHSLNPASGPLLPRDTLRWHFAGGNDRLVPAKIVATAAARDPYAQYRLHPTFDHTCCWRRIWPSTLEALGTALDRKR